MPQRFINWVSTSTKSRSVRSFRRARVRQSEAAAPAELRVKQLERSRRRVARFMNGGSSAAFRSSLAAPARNWSCTPRRAPRAAPASFLQNQRNLPHRFQIGRDVVAALAVAARRAQDELPVFVPQRDSDPVNLQLDDVPDRLSGSAPSAPAHPTRAARRRNRCCRSKASARRGVPWRTARAAARPLAGLGCRQ